MTITTENRIRAASDAISLAEATAFIWREAEMLDAHDYKPWLALWTEAGRYVIPIDRTDGDYAAALNIAYDDAEMRSARVKRLLSGFAMSSAPAARTVRTVSRFVIEGCDSNATIVRAAQTIVEFKYERTRILAADMIYRLVRDDKADSLKLDGKVVRLINSDGALHGIGYLF